MTEKTGGPPRCERASAVSTMAKTTDLLSRPRLTRPTYLEEHLMSTTFHWARLFVALAASAAFASLVAALAVAAGTKLNGATVATAKSPLGRILVDSRGITLYDFPKDKGTTSSCYGACAALWPPLTTKGKPVAGRGVQASLLGTTKRKDGKLQVTYKKHPLYTYIVDKKPGQKTGEGSKLFGAGWYALTPTGVVIDKD